jgi:hypothetical protein
MLYFQLPLHAAEVAVKRYKGRSLEVTLATAPAGATRPGRLAVGQERGNLVLEVLVPRLGDYSAQVIMELQPENAKALCRDLAQRLGMVVCEPAVAAKVVGLSMVGPGEGGRGKIVEPQQDLPEGTCLYVQEKL